MMRNAISFLGTTLSAIAIVAIAFVAIVVVHGSLSSVTSIVSGLLSSHAQIEVALCRVSMTSRSNGPFSACFHSAIRLSMCSLGWLRSTS